MDLKVRHPRSYSLSNMTSETDMLTNKAYTSTQWVGSPARDLQLIEIGRQSTEHVSNSSCLTRVEVNGTEVQEKESHRPSIDESFHNPGNNPEGPRHEYAPVEEDHAEFREAEPKDREKLQGPVNLEGVI